MKILVVSAMAALSLASTASAGGPIAVASQPSASTTSRITDCGWWGGVGWTRTAPQGFSMHLTTRNVRCSFARPFMRRYRGTDSYFPRWTCREINQYESADVRCVSGVRVIRWVGGA
jgi:hypothetical protein